jgi:hypothetical protein
MYPTSNSTRMYDFNNNKRHYLNKKKSEGIPGKKAPLILRKASDNISRSRNSFHHVKL